MNALNSAALKNLPTRQYPVDVTHRCTLCNTKGGGGTIGGHKRSGAKGDDYWPSGTPCPFCGDLCSHGFPVSAACAEAH